MTLILALTILFISMAAGVSYAEPQSLPELPNVMVRVNGAVITRAEFETRIAQSRSMNPDLFDRMIVEQRERAMERVLNGMILRELQVQEAIRLGIVVRESEVEQRYAEMEARFADRTRHVLADFQITPAQWREETRRNLLIEKLEDLLRSEIPVSEEEIRQEPEATHPAAHPKPREDLRRLIRQRKWMERKDAWIRSLVNAAEIRRWTPALSGQRTRANPP